MLTPLLCTVVRSSARLQLGWMLQHSAAVVSLHCFGADAGRCIGLSHH